MHKRLSVLCLRVVSCENIISDLFVFCFVLQRGAQSVYQSEGKDALNRVTENTSSEDYNEFLYGREFKKLQPSRPASVPQRQKVAVARGRTAVAVYRRVACRAGFAVSCFRIWFKVTSTPALIGGARTLLIPPQRLSIDSAECTMRIHGPTCPNLVWAIRCVFSVFKHCSVEIVVSFRVS